MFSLNFRMRAKEYLEFRKQDFFYFELVEKIIRDLYPLRCDRAKTEEYFNRYLFADAKYKANRHNEVQEGEVEPTIAVEVRNEVRHAIRGDRSFVIAHNIIAEGRNKFYRSELMSLGDTLDEDIKTESRVKEMRVQYREDYPKSKLSDYLLDPHIREFYKERNGELQKKKEWWLAACNKAYELFDEIRVQFNDPFQGKEMVENYNPGDTDLKYTVVGLTCCLLEHYKIESPDEHQEKMNILKGLVQEYYANGCRLYSPGEEIEKLKADLAREKQERAALAEAKNNLENQLAEAIRMAGKGGMTVAETALTFYYLFDEMGVDFSNSDKTKWARFIHAITGKSEQRIRNSLYFDFDQKSTRKNLRSIAGIFSELFPAIKQKILNDMQET